MEPVYAPIVAAARTMFVLQGLDITVSGAENFPKEGGGVLVINHTGYLDFIFGGIAPREHKRYVRYMAKVEVFDHKISGPLMRGCKHIPVDRTAGGDSYRAAVSDLERGELVGVFPEATISRSFEIKEFKSGAVRMALEADVPIFPVVVWGSQRIWTKGQEKNLLRPKVPVLIEVGQPFTAFEPIDDCLQKLRTQMQSTLERLQTEYAEKYGPYPPGAPWVPRRLGGSAPTLEEATALDIAEQEERLRKRAEREGRATAGGSEAAKDPGTGEAPDELKVTDEGEG